LNYNKQFSTSTLSSNSTNTANNSSTIESTKPTEAPITYILRLCRKIECPMGMVQKVRKRILHWCSYMCECAKGLEMKGLKCQKPITTTELMTTVPKIMVYVQRSCGANMIYIERCDFHPISGHMRKCQKISNCVCDVQLYFASDGLCLKIPKTTKNPARLAKKVKMAVRIL
uniref:TAZ-type domain-containing protein n=1 Tax=Dracunculus medinensis TaxID=318479 RepID=A0A0N4UI35_DRAME